MSRTSTDGVDSKEMEFYLMSNLNPDRMGALLKLEKKDDNEIEVFMKAYNSSRSKLRKVMKKFRQRIVEKPEYSALDKSDLVKKGMKFAEKHDFTEAEKHAFVNYVMNDDIDKEYTAFGEMQYTEMSKFLGLSNYGDMFDVKATDHSALDEIVRLYEDSRMLYENVKENLHTYYDCSLDVITSVFRADKHKVHCHIHPVIVALFVPKIYFLENRMLRSNIGRIVVSRSAPTLRRHIGSNVHTDQWDLNADKELTYSIARDPNSLNYFTEETPMNNLLKRYKVQIELYKNIMALRQGRLYSNQDYSAPTDDITGLTKMLTAYDWTYYDSPELAHVVDEGTILRKLLAVFSVRPTFTQLSSFASKFGMGATNFDLAKISFVNTPIINIKLPVNLYGQQAMPAVDMKNALTQMDFFIENKMIVPKNKAVVYSEKMAFVYANRRFQSVNLANLNVYFNYMSLPGTVSGVTSINTTEMIYENPFRIGSKKYALKSVVVLNSTARGSFASHACSTVFVSEKNPQHGRNLNMYWYYNPISANVKIRQPTGAIVSNDPFVTIPRIGGPNQITFDGLARRFGTVFVYSE